VSTYGPHRDIFERAKRRQRRTGYGVGVVFLLIIVIGIFTAVAYKNSDRVVTAKISYKDRVCKSTDQGSDCEYLVFTDQGTFKVKDTLLYLNFKSSDVYGRLEIGSTYRMKVAGWRLGIFSQYPNIVEVQQRIS
jgi:hypothetical protein